LPVGQLQLSFAAQGYLAFLGRITRQGSGRRRPARARRGIDDLGGRAVG
jgi:hypothetical protein